LEHDGCAADLSFAGPSPEQAAHIAASMNNSAVRCFMALLR
jgi:hypothetical protein